MNIDALFEDLEALAFFHAREPNTPDVFDSKLVVVHRIPSGQGNLVLSSPILGYDFIAGFAKREKPIWIVLPSIAFSRVETLDEHFRLSKADFSLAELIQQKLIRENVGIVSDQGLLAKLQILSSFGSSIEILKDGKVSQLSTSGIRAIVVENLSSL